MAVRGAAAFGCGEYVRVRYRGAPAAPARLPHWRVKAGSSPSEVTQRSGGVVVADGKHYVGPMAAS